MENWNADPRVKELADKRRELREQKRVMNEEILRLQRDVQRITGMVMLLSEQMGELMQENNLHEEQFDAED